MMGSKSNVALASLGPPGPIEPPLGTRAPWDRLGTWARLAPCGRRAGKVERKGGRQWWAGQVVSLVVSLVGLDPGLEGLVGTFSEVEML